MKKTLQMFLIFLVLWSWENL